MVGEVHVFVRGGRGGERASRVGVGSGVDSQVFLAENGVE